MSEPLWSVRGQTTVEDPALIGKIKIVMITSSNDEADRGKAAQYPHITAYMVKPVEAQAFKKVIEMLKE